MDEKPHRFPGTLLARLGFVRRGGRTRAGELRSPQDIVAMPRDCQAGPACGEARDVGEQRRLHRIAQWTCLRGRGL